MLIMNLSINHLTYLFHYFIIYLFYIIILILDYNLLTKSTLISFLTILSTHLINLLISASIHFELLIDLSIDESYELMVLSLTSFHSSSILFYSLALLYLIQYLSIS